MEVLLHTAQSHCVLFERTFKAAAKTLPQQIVRSEWLQWAQNPDDAARLQAAFVEFLPEVTEIKNVVCTCTTLAPLLEQYIAANQLPVRLARLDSGLVAWLKQQYEPVLLVYALASAQSATENYLAAQGVSLDAAHMASVLCASAWPHFVAGEYELFAKQLQQTIVLELKRRPVKSVVFTQASMAGVQSHVVLPVDTALYTSVQLFVEGH